MEIAFITDLHLPSAGEYARGVDTYKNLELILEDIANQKIDFLIIGGDVSFTTPDQNANLYLDHRLKMLDIPYTVVPGNHDSRDQLKEVFSYPEDHDEIYYVKQIGTESFVFLDSTEGVLSETQLRWLEKTLQGNTQVSNIFIHHPVLMANIPYMDNNHSLRNMNEVQEILKACGRNIAVFSGHYHTEKLVVKDNIIQYITPSTFIQIDQNQPEFKIDHLTPGYRIIQIEGSTVFSYVRYIWS